MKKLIAKFDNTIRLSEFDEQIQKLVVDANFHYISDFFKGSK